MELSLIMQELQSQEAQFATLRALSRTSFRKRDIEYFDKIELLKKSLLKLDPENGYENIRKYYHSCIDYGFTVINM